MKFLLFSGGSRPSDKAGGGHTDPEIRGGGGGGGASIQTFFGTLGLILVKK